MCSLFSTNHFSSSLPLSPPISPSLPHPPQPLSPSALLPPLSVLLNCSSLPHSVNEWRNYPCHMMWVCEVIDVSLCDMFCTVRVFSAWKQNVLREYSTEPLRGGSASVAIWTLVNREVKVEDDPWASSVGVKGQRWTIATTIWQTNSQRRVAYGPDQ